MTYSKEELLNFVWQFNLYFTGHSEIVPEESINFAVSPEVEDNRMNVCRGCEHFNSKRLDCNLCGCYLPDKTTETGESCPDNRWDMDSEGWLSGAKELIEAIEKHTSLKDE